MSKFSISEAFNSKYYGDWSIEEFDPQTVANYTAAYITESNPAKKIILKRKAGASDSNYEDTDYFMIALNNESVAPNIIYVGMNTLPFTIEGVLITKFSFNLFFGESEVTDETKDLLELISYH
ncbi:MAG: hypothetical protein H8E74_01190 [Gammaproteobacteria bacterium]|nr:hypothetical protein [Gammaproteobacteria bacterium]